jgi:hypothetical protein
MIPLSNGVDKRHPDAFPSSGLLNGKLDCSAIAFFWSRFGPSVAPNGVRIGAWDCHLANLVDVASADDEGHVPVRARSRYRMIFAVQPNSSHRSRSPRVKPGRRDGTGAWQYQSRLVNARSTQIRQQGYYFCSERQVSSRGLPGGQ